MVDGGYDVADYRSVDPRFGSLQDAEALVDDAHRTGLRVLLDIVPNHTSDQHPWFQEAVAAGPGSTQRRRYLFRPGQGSDGTLPPNDWRSVFGSVAWTRVTEPDGRPGEWYLHLFAAEQPDLDWTHPEVRADFEKTLRFWFDLGVDGFRIDVAHSLVKQEGLPDLADGQPPELLTDAAAWPAGEHPLGPGRGSRRPPRLAGRGGLVRRAPGLRRRGLGGRAGAAGPLRPAGRAAHRLRLRLPGLAVAGRPAAPGHQLDPDRARRRGAPPTWVLSNHDTVRPVSRYAREPADGPTFSLQHLAGRPTSPVGPGGPGPPRC